MKKIILFILIITIGCNPREKISINSTFVFNEASIHYKVDGDGEPVLFIHGGYLDLSMWDSQIDDLTKAGFQVIRYSDISHGKTESVKEEILGCEIAKRLIDELGIKKINLVGLSWGAMLAADYALTYPENIDRMILVSPGLNGWQYFVDSLAAQNAQEGYKALERGDTLSYAESFQRNWTDGPRREKSKVNAKVREKIGSMIRSNLRSHGGKNWSKLQSPPAIERLEEISCPTLLVVGEYDVLNIPLTADLLSKRIQNTQTYEMKSVEHTLNMENPKEFNRIVIEFLKEK